jgi:hypothetical protein
MVKLTKAQRKALKRIYDRTPTYPYITSEERTADITAIPLTYRQFRKTVHPGGPDYVMVQWARMWLGIEKDGYTHS